MCSITFIFLNNETPPATVIAKSNEKKIGELIFQLIPHPNYKFMSIYNFYKASIHSLYGNVKVFAYDEDEE